MKIYTKTGDSGETALFGGKRVPKNHSRVEAYGTIDEANAYIGLICARISQPHYREQLRNIQEKLFEIGSALANPNSKELMLKHEDVLHLETLIDQMTAALPELRTFILPGGSEAAAMLHVARSITRRAERRMITVNQNEHVHGVIIRYVNRLSDYLFTLARMVNFEEDIKETPWHSNPI